MKRIKIILMLLFVIIFLILVCSCSDNSRFSVTYIAEEGGAIQGETNQKIKSGQNGIYVTAVPQTGYRFVGWSDGNESPIRQEINVQSDITVTAKFVLQTYEITYIAGVGGTIQGKASQTVTGGKNSEYVTAVPQTGYRFVGWSDGNESPIRQEINVQSDITVTARFVPVVTVTLIYSTDGNGRIKGEDKQVLTQHSDGKTVTAVPNPGFQFLRWSDGVTEAQRQDTDIVTDLNLTAYFTLGEYLISYDAIGGGSITGNVKQLLVSGQYGEEVTAVPDEGYKFVNWSDGVKTPTRRDQVTVIDKNLTAYFRKLQTFTVEYCCSGPGYIEGTMIQRVIEGESTTEVTAVLETDSAGVFMGWSDGVKSYARKDENITCDMRIEADFRYGGYIEYLVDGKGGSIDGETMQLALDSEGGAKGVTAVPDDGYVFVGWSDRFSEPARTGDKFYSNDPLYRIQKVYKIVAYFEPIVKTFYYEYNGSDSHPPVDSVCIERQSPKDAQFVIPARQGYRFDGWYADSAYTLKVVNADGRLMLGYYTAAVQSDTLYAKWLPESEQRNIYPKILIVAVEEADVTLTDKNGEIKNMRAKLEARERAYYMQSIRMMLDLLNLWFEGSVPFEIDVYFTTDLIKNGQNGIQSEPFGYPYRLKVENIPETQDLYNQYGSVLGIQKVCEEYDYEFVYGRECDYGRLKYGNAYFTSYDMRTLYFPTLCEDMVEDARFISQPYWLNCDLMHEYVHTIEGNFKCLEGWSFKSSRHYDLSFWRPIRKYLTHTTVIGETVTGIPPSYWTEGGDYY